MQVTFESRDCQGESMREVAVAKVHFAMRRFAFMAPNAKVQFADVNGPRGGVDKLCRVELRTHTAGIVTVTALAKDWRTALDLSLARAISATKRIWQKRQKSPRGAIHRIAPQIALES